jgi:hypothetical protein
MRRVKWASTSWLSAGRIRRDRFLRLLSNEQTKALFDDVFIRGVEDRKNALDARQLKIVGLQFPIFMFLLFTLIPINVPISILGISPSGSQGLREIVLLVWASLATYASLVSIEQNSLRDILLAFVSHRASGSSDAQEVLKLRYGLSQLWMAEPADDHIVRSRVWALVATACIIGVLILLFMLGLILVGNTPLSPVRCLPTSGFQSTHHSIRNHLRDRERRSGDLNILDLFCVVSLQKPRKLDEVGEAAHVTWNREFNGVATFTEGI